MSKPDREMDRPQVSETGFLARAWNRLEKHDIVLCSLILACIVILAYGEVVFFGYTLSPATFSPGVNSVGSYGYEGRAIAQWPQFDAWASGIQDFPIGRLVAQYLRSGQLPLWNPYMAGGTPLGADTSISAFVLLKILYLFPGGYDLSILLKIWLAGVFMVLFLREMKLGRTPAIAGALFYMFCGAITWYSTENWIDVCMFAPLLMYAAERVIQRSNRSDVALLSLAVFLSILGSFIETIILQFILVILFFVFRALTLGRMMISVRRFILAFVTGMGLSGFYLLIVFEYLANSALGNPPGVGNSSLPYWIFGTLFVPYILGGPGQYWTTNTGIFIEVSLPGYVGILCLFFSIIAIVAQVESRKRMGGVALFFMSVGILAVLKTFGNPIINWIGQLPVMQFIVFYKFLGFFWAFCFATCAAYGFDAVLKGVRRRVVLVALGTSFAVVLAALVVLVPFFSDPSLMRIPTTLPSWAQAVPAWQFILYYLGWRAGEACLLLIVAASLCFGVVRDRSLSWALICLVAIEMAWYVPRGLPYSRQLVQSAWVSASIVALWLVVMRPASLRKIAAKSLRQGHLPACGPMQAKHLGFALFVIVVLIGQAAISAASPLGLPNRYDNFREPPYITFLEKNGGHSRIYSIEYTLISSYAGIYGLQTIGIIGAFNVDTFDRFARAHLDSQKHTTNFDWEYLHPWPAGLGNASLDELRKNRVFYDLLGVRYIVARSNLTHLMSMPLAYSGEVSIYENPQAFPRTFLMECYRTVSDSAGAMQMLNRPDFDPRSEIVIEDPKGQLRLPDAAECDEPAHHPATLRVYEPNRVVIDVETDRPALLILTDTYYPGWRAEVDGQDAPIYRADGLFRAIAIGPGSHAVVLTYLPWSFLIGLVMTTSTAFLLICYCINLRRSRRRGDTPTQVIRQS